MKIKLYPYTTVAKMHPDLIDFDGAVLGIRKETYMQLSKRPIRVTCRLQLYRLSKSGTPEFYIADELVQEVYVDRTVKEERKEEQKK